MSQTYGDRPDRVPATRIPPGDEPGATRRIPPTAGGRAVPDVGAPPAVRIPPRQVVPAAPPQAYREPSRALVHDDGRRGPRPDDRLTPAGEPRRRGTDVASVASLVTALVGLVVPLLSVLAIVLGAIGIHRTRRRGTKGRGMASIGTTLGVVELLLTAALAVGAWALWSTYGDDLQRGLEQAQELSGQAGELGDLGDLGALLGDQLTSGFSPDRIGDLATTLGDADELRGLAEQCQGGDPAACDELLQSVPEGVLPEGVSPGSGG